MAEAFIIIAILSFVIFLLWRSGFWRWLNSQITPEPKPKTGIGVTTNTDENLSEEQRLLRSWLWDIVM